MPKLTDVEKVAGRKFRDDQQAALTALFDSDPVEHRYPNFLAHGRHLCPARDGRSTAMELKEVYVLSPAYLVSPGGLVTELAPTDGGDLTNKDEIAFSGWPVGRVEDAVAALTLVPAGRFCWIYKEGKCRGCKERGRSPAGRLDDAWERPPIHGKVARSAAAKTA